MRAAYVLTLALCVSYATAQLDDLLLERQQWVQVRAPLFHPRGGVAVRRHQPMGTTKMRALRFVVLVVVSLRHTPGPRWCTRI